MEAGPATKARVARVLAAFDRELPDAAQGALAAWIDLIAAWNAKIDLTAARSDDELADLMLADAAVLSARVGAGRRVVDVGSGAGAPGLPLAVARPDLEVTLVEPVQKRVAFLRTAIGTLVRAGAPLGAPPRVERARGEDLARSGAAFDVAISRATLAPGEWLELGAALVGGAPAEAREVWVLLAREPPPARPGWAAADDVRYRWPLTGAERRAVRFVPA